MKDKAQEIMRAIERKLVGQMGKNASAKLPISTEGQVGVMNQNILIFNCNIK